MQTCFIIRYNITPEHLSVILKIDISVVISRYVVRLSSVRMRNSGKRPELSACYRSEFVILKAKESSVKEGAFLFGLCGKRCKLYINLRSCFRLYAHMLPGFHSSQILLYLKL